MYIILKLHISFLLIFILAEKHILAKYAIQYPQSS